MNAVNPAPRSVLSVAVLCASLTTISCAPRIAFPIESSTPSPPRLALGEIIDARPVHEHVGYKIFYIDSITDSDYAEGFVPTFRQGLTEALQQHFQLVDTGAATDLTLEVEVRHFFGEYARPLESVVFENLALLCLGIPRLVGDLIPYNAFAGRVSFVMRFGDPDGQRWEREVDVQVYDQVATIRRNPAATADMLGSAATEQLEQVFMDVARGKGRTP